MKEFIKEFYKSYYREDLIQYIERPSPTPIVIPKMNGDKLYEIAIKYMGIDPTPNDEAEDGNACVHSLTTILKKLLPDFPVLTYTPTFLQTLKKDPRFREIAEFKKGAIIISPTNTGNGTIIGHTGICGENGKIMSNSSATGLWSDKFDQINWIKRYSQLGGLDLHIFELV